MLRLLCWKERFLLRLLLREGLTRQFDKGACVTS